uniref:Uncharacterized protein n=1 Tax=Manihot esculenta TaxID=3983 RepID=A0A2C9WLV7_MANES
MVYLVFQIITMSTVKPPLSFLMLLSPSSCLSRL